MYILFFNTIWMIWNLLLAILGVFFSWVIYKAKSKFVKLLIFSPWLLFVPNTIYILTDLVHLRWEIFEIGGVKLVLLIIQFLIFIPLSIVTYYLSMRLFDVGMRKYWDEITKRKISFDFFVVILNFAFAFAVAMGRFTRTNSWDVAGDPWRVARDIFTILTSFNAVVFVVVFGVFVNLLYLGMRKMFTN